MKKSSTCFYLLLVFLFQPITNMQAAIDKQTITRTIEAISASSPEQKELIERGVNQVARLWQDPDGDATVFEKFCKDNYITDPAEKEIVFLKISDYLEGINGYYNQMYLRLQKNVTLDNGPLHAIDERFGSYNPSAHLSEDFYKNKIAFYIALNFPYQSLEEKEKLGTDRKAWAYARMGDMYTQRVPSEIHQNAGLVSSDADMYIAQYNIYMGKLLNPKGKQIFPDDMILLSHWNLRDEIKANYNKGKEGLEKQRTVYEVMKRIIAQDIPVEVINSGEYNWNPYTNTIYQAGRQITGTPEESIRYQKMLNNFDAMKAYDEYTGNTFNDRKFNQGMEMAMEDVEVLLSTFLSSPELKEVGKIISKRLGRKLEAYDIWYDGFKARSSLDETKLDEQTRTLYPDAAALEKDLSNILVKLGFTRERADYLGEKIAVDPARGSGHAWGSAMKGQQSRLRTRIPAQGMDYKGYNIAIHEFGHNVEQTISMYDVDYYMLSGVPNTSFTEALAFVFQKRDLDILGIQDNNPEKRDMDILDKVWTLYEISGVSLLDIEIWKWLYQNPEATASQLKEATLRLSKEVWNQYYAPVFGVKDETVLAVYSHMIGYPLYLSAYAFGQIIEFQLENYLQGKDFAPEVSRIFQLGTLTPNQWMLQATGEPLTVEPLLEAVRDVIGK